MTKRPDLPQVILAVAINRDGLPVRHRVFPGHTVDATTVEQVSGDLAGLRPRRFLFVGDRGMVSQSNVDFLESRGQKYLLGAGGSGAHGDGRYRAPRSEWTG